MLPFLKRKDEVSISPMPDKIKREPDSEEEDLDYLSSCMSELASALKADDHAAAASAFRAAFEILSMGEESDVASPSS